MQIISDNDFSSVMDEFAVTEGEVFAVGVSGGADSICLCRMLARYAEKNGYGLLALTVDHRLRPESAAEAEQVHKWLTALGIKHKTLVWEGEKPLTSIEEEARLARYALLIKECKQQGIRFLCLAHNENDNVETFFMRLAKSGGVDGLSGIRPRSERNGITVLRPLLTFTREQIIATDKFLNQAWIEDPSNENEMYERVRLRKARPLLDNLGLSLEAVSKTMEKMAGVSTYLQKLQVEFCRNFVLTSSFGFLKVSLRQLVKLDEEVAVRVLARCIEGVGNNGEYTYPLRIEKLKDLFAKIKQADFKSATLGGTVIAKKDKGSWLYVVKEERHTAADKQVFEKQTLWDRFTLDFDGDLPSPLYVGKLGNTPLPDELKEVKKLFSANILKTIPVIKDKDGLLLIPLLGYKRSGSVSNIKCDCTFNLCF